MKRTITFCVALGAFYAVFGTAASASYRSARSADEVRRIYESFDQLCYTEGHYTEAEIEAMTRIKQAGADAMNGGTGVSITEIVNREVSNRTLADALIAKFPGFVMCVMRESQRLQERPYRPPTSTKS
ncbi:uncharacterized protein LOC8027377 [Ixodes scapularis]|uniref:Uncharacterized protein n=1 Tax=Ixodes scapularis TaxID=6945 RepID=B7PBE9_IXOSC|nr:uncharacterized protein LOC8027377 [Ixodes scapularis]EEC03921.1 hypothetical protein IscW_ISCW003120 [Ixodes scapularis]|eukprot:XP_002408002.1 hypothetical protein IscW_ISCW003120 [Ixodes scapularis]